MKCISKVWIIDDDIAVAELNTWETVQLYMIHKNDQTYYKIKIDNILCPVGTTKSWVMFTKFTTFFYY